MKRPPLAGSRPRRWSYDAAERHLLSFVNYEALARGRPMVRNRADLERFARALGRLGHPERCAPAIHVAGTNGKGSTAAMIAALLNGLGHRTGLYTSPHLVEMRERVQVDGRPIGRAEFAAAARQAADSIAGERSSGFRTTFEMLTALAFLAFRARQVDAMVIEVGLGGRLDSTNVLDPAVVVITPVGLDHREVLGPDLATIAADKAGILKRGVPAVSARQARDALGALNARARRLGVTLESAAAVEVSEARPTLAGETFSLRTPVGVYPGIRLALRGTHQIQNAALALRAVELFRRGALAPEVVRRAFRRVRWPGRFQILSRSRPLVLDGAHNPDGAAQLAATLDRYWPGKPVAFVFGASMGKDVPAVLEALRGRARALIAVAARHPRAEDPERLAALARTRLGCRVETARDARTALIAARRLAGERGVVCVAGSLYLVGDMLQLWPGLRRQWNGGRIRIVRPDRRRGAGTVLPKS